MRYKSAQPTCAVWGTIGCAIRAAFVQYTVRYMERMQSGCFLCAVITPLLVAAMISAQNETYLKRGGWGSALGIAGKSPQSGEDLQRKARPVKGTPKTVKRKPIQPMKIHRKNGTYIYQAERLQLVFTRSSIYYNPYFSTY